MTEPKPIYETDSFRLSNPQVLPLSDLLAQIEMCGYHTGTGDPLEKNVYFVELRRRAKTDSLNERAVILAGELFDEALKFLNGELRQDTFEQNIARIIGYQQTE